MGCTRVLATIAGFILLLPGVCYLALGNVMKDQGAAKIGLLFLAVAALLIGGAFALGFYRRKSD